MSHVGVKVPLASLPRRADIRLTWLLKREAYQSACHEILYILVTSFDLQASKSLRNLMRDDNAPHYFHVATYKLQQRRRSRKARDDPDRMATSWRNPFFYAQSTIRPAQKPLRDRRHRAVAPAYVYLLHGLAFPESLAGTQFIPIAQSKEIATVCQLLTWTLRYGSYPLGK